MATRFDNDVYVAGSLIPVGGITLPSSSVTNTSVQAGADILASKLEHQHEIVFSQDIGVDCASQAKVVHVVYGTSGTIVAFKAGAVTVAGATTTVAVDLKKNGTTCLSSTITLNNTQTAYQLVTGTLSVTTLTAGDVLSVHFTLTGSNKPQGVFATLVLTEKAS